MNTPTTLVEDAPAAPVDPRMRARRIAVRRSDARKRLRRVITVGVVFAFVAAGLLAVRSPVLDVDRIQVHGADHTGEDAVRAATGIAVHESMVDVDAGGARDRLLALPWVERATVTRRWPATIEVDIVERTAVAAQAAGPAGYATLDGSGRVLEVAATPPPGLTLLVGIGDAGPTGSLAGPDARGPLTIAAALPATLAPRVAAIERDGAGVLDLRVTEAGTAARVVRLGTVDDLPAKLLAALTVLEQVELTDVCVIDVRVPTAPSLTRASPCL